MQKQGRNHILICPGCQIQITVSFSADFKCTGQMNLLCTKCKKSLTNINTTKINRTSVPKQPAGFPNTTQANINAFRPNVTAQAFKTETSARINVEAELTVEDNLPAPKVGDYNLIKRIGKGAMGEIVLGEHSETKNKVAIKLLSEEHQKSEQARERFLQEAKVHSRLSRLVHANIVRIYDVGYCTTAGMLYLVMEYVDGESLEKILISKGSIAPRHSLKIAIAVAHALEHALEQHIIHRDLKPANIMIDRNTRRVKLADLGLGKIALAEEKGVTLSGQMMGTLYYMPPEQIKDAKTVDHKADIYALGGTLYHMLTGRPPYSEVKGALQILRAKMTRDPIPVDEYVDNISDTIIGIVDKAMARNTNNRYETPTEMVLDMEKALSSLP